MRRALIADKMDHNEHAQRQRRADEENQPIANVLVERNAQRRRHCLAERIGSAVEPHACASVFLWQKSGDPGRHTDRAAGHAEPVDNARQHHHPGCRRQHIAGAPDKHQRCTDRGEMRPTEPVSEVADKGSAQKRHGVKRCTDHPHEHRACAKAFRIAGDERRGDEGARHIKEACDKNQTDVAGEQSRDHKITSRLIDRI